MPRGSKRTFKALPAGASGSSTNPDTVARNQRRRKLNPLQAEYERARANKGNRISSKIKRLKKAAAYIDASTDEERGSMEQAIRDTEESVYQTDRVEISQLHAEMLAAADTGPAADTTSATAEGPSTVAAGGTAQLARLTAKLSTAGPVRDMETAGSADGSAPAEVVPSGQDGDGKMGEEVKVDEGEETSNGSESFDGVLFDFDAESEDMDMDMDEENVGSEEEEDIVAEKEGGEEISGEELRRRIAERNKGVLARLEELALADEAERQRRRKRKRKEM